MKTASPSYVTKNKSRRSAEKLSQQKANWSAEKLSQQKANWWGRKTRQQENETSEKKSGRKARKSGKREEITNMEEKTYVDDIDRSVYDIKDEEHDAFRIEEGLTP